MGGVHEHGTRPDAVGRAVGSRPGVRGGPVGAGVYGTTARLEKGYRLMGAELESEYNPVEAGLARPRVKAADFIGKEAYLAARAAGPAAVCCTLTMDAHVSASGHPPVPDGRQRTDPRRERGADRGLQGPGVPGHLGGRCAIPGHLHPARVPPHGPGGGGRELRIMYQNELFPATVARVGSKPLFDPDDSRMKR